MLKRILVFLLISSFIIQFGYSLILKQPLYQENRQMEARVIKLGAKLMLKPSEGSLVLMNLPLGATFEVKEALGEWVKVDLPSDKDGIIVSGFINISFIEIRSFQSTNITKPISQQPAIQQVESKETNDIFVWQSKLVKAKQKTSAGVICAVVGVAVLIPSLVVTFTPPEVPAGHLSAERSTGAQILCIIGDVAGISLTTLGIIFINGGDSAKAQLMDEGKIKGYLNAGILPRHKAIGIQIGASF